MSEAELKFEIRGGVVHITVPGSLYEQAPCDSLAGLVKHNLGAGNKSFAVDVTQCSAISWYGVGQLLGMNDLVKTGGGSIVFSGLRKEVRDVLAALLLDQILQLKS